MSNDRTRFAPKARSLTVAALFLFVLIIASYGLWLPPKSAAATSELFFSEYIEGSSNNKALEIYNGTGAPVDLATGGYKVQMFFNGSTSAGLTINLTGTIANGDVFVLAQASADAVILAQADLTNGNGWFNGDDAVVLLKGTTIVDVIGQVGIDPGTEWGSGLTSTADNTIRRKASICAGDTNGSDAFSPATEWDGFANDTFGGLGAHTANCGLNQSISPSCPGSLSTAEGTATSEAVTATDPDGTVTNATITSTGTTPIEPGITLTGITPASGVGGIATATLNVASTTPQGTYSVVIEWQNNDSPTPQTATCTVNVTVTPPATPTPTPTPTPVPGSVVISQVYGGGGNTGATLKNDFVELINHSAAPIDLSGWSVQIASA
ncbi:MAG TPA: lamin tail domain-containing protein, partial [Pyrinomonadaceae bacterium]